MAQQAPAQVRAQEKWIHVATKTHSSVLAWRIPGTGEPRGLQSMGLHRIRHDWSNLAAAATKNTRRNHSTLIHYSLNVETEMTVVQRLDQRAVACSRGGARTARHHRGTAPLTQHRDLTHLWVIPPQQVKLTLG